MAASAEKTDPKLWEQVKRRVTRGSKGGDPGEWSARKAQIAVAEYKKAGGGYKGRKSADNHLSQWTKEEWGTRSGKPSKKTGERYLPRKARQKLTKEEYDRTTAKKRADTRKGRQFSAQPKDVAKKTASARRTGAKRTPARKAATRKAPARSTTAARKPAARKAPVRKAPARKTTARKAPARKTDTRKTAARKPAARKAPARGAAAKRPAAKRPAGRK
jgi:hypothetical protein